MDIKLRARLTAYSKVESFDNVVDNTPDHVCNMTPISKESIDELFKHKEPDEGTGTSNAAGKSFIDALF